MSKDCDAIAEAEFYEYNSSLEREKFESEKRERNYPETLKTIGFAAGTRSKYRSFEDWIATLAKESDKS